MYEQKALNPSQLLVQQRNRKSTDVFCTLIGAIIPLVMFITACAMWNRANFQNNFFNFRTSGSKQLCKEGQYVLIVDPKNFNDQKCVAQCPNSWKPDLGLCLPADDESRQNFLNHPPFAGIFDYQNFKQTLIWSFIVGLTLGILWMVFSFCFPKIAPIVSHLVGAIILIVLGIFALVLNDGFWVNNLGLKIIFTIFCFSLSLILLAMLCWWPNQRKFQGIMLDYAKIFLIQNCTTFLYLPLFFIFAIGLFTLIVWQHCCFSSSLGTGSDFWNFSNPGFFGILNIFQLIWGLRFLRDAFNFCISGNAVDWYWHRPNFIHLCLPFSRLICKHWGSVVGGSLLNSFFTIPTLIAQLLICHPQACCSRMGTFCYNTCNKLFCFCDLVRTDSYSYINMTGIPFCNSSRQVKKINEKNPAYVGYHSPMNHYRFSAHCLVIPLAIMLTWFILGFRVINRNAWHWIVLVFVLYSIINWFINLLADIAEGLQTSFLAERQLENGDFSRINKLLPNFKTPLQHMERRVHGEGDGFI